MNRIISFIRIGALLIGVTVAQAQLAFTQPAAAPATTAAGQNAASPAQSDPNGFLPLPSYAAGAGVYNGMGRGARGPGNVLVIRSTDPEPQAEENLREDLAVMGHIFDNTLSDEVGLFAFSHPTAMGIDVFFPAERDGIRSLYLEGYGAMFMVRVDFSLLPPPKETADQKEKEPTDSTWEAAKRELYGQPSNGDPTSRVANDYNEERVKKLKNALIDALRNAKNIRGLKGEEFITVCVLGQPNRLAGNSRLTGRHSNNAWRSDDYQALLKGNGGGFGGGGAYYLRTPVEVLAGEDSSAGGTILTIRVRKADVDALGSGRMTNDEFRGKASVAGYTGGPESAPTRAAGR